MRHLLPLTAGLLLLSACNTGPVVLPPASIDITGIPANNKAKVNASYDLDGVAKAADGSVAPNVSVAWTSSDPNVASVTADGVVTVKKLGATPVTITATAGAITRNVVLDTYGLDLVMGTYNLAIDGLPTQGTIFARVRLPDGTAPNAAVNVTLTGPTGWNSDRPLTVPVPAVANIPNKTFTAATYTSPAVAGTYRATTTVGGEAYEATSVLNVTEVLPVPTNITVTDVSRSSVSASWSAVPGATTYYVQVFDCTGNTGNPLACTQLASFNIKSNTQVTINGLNLTAGATKTYTVGVRALTLDPLAVDVPTPNAFLASFAGRDFQVPAQ